MNRLPPEKSARDLNLNVKIGNRLQRIARLIEKELTKAGADKDEVQFSLLVWGPGRMQYVSNAERSSVRDGMAEMVEKWDRAGEDLGKPSLPLGGLDKARDQ